MDGWMDGWIKCEPETRDREKDWQAERQKPRGTEEERDTVRQNRTRENKKKRKPERNIETVTAQKRPSERQRRTDSCVRVRQRDAGCRQVHILTKGRGGHRKTGWESKR